MNLYWSFKHIEVEIEKREERVKIVQSSVSFCYLCNRKEDPEVTSNKIAVRNLST